MAEFRLERFKYNWRGIWASSTAYKRDDVVRLNGKSYVCLVTHTSNLSFRTDLNAVIPQSNPPQPQPRWTIMTGGKAFIGNYQLGIDYNLGDIVLYDGNLWLCTVPHNSTNFSSQISNWEVFINSISFVGDWSIGRAYGIGAVVKYNGISYKCIVAHTSTATLESNEENWEVFNNGIEYKGSWEPTTLYRKNDLVKYGGTIFRCTETHTSNTTNLDDDYFQIEFFGSQFNNDWDNETYYNVGDIVRHRGFMYYAIENNYDSNPFQESGSSADWLLLARSYYFVGEWSLTGNYKTGDIVLRGGNLYLALRDIGSDGLDGSTVDYLEDDTWELLVPGKKWKSLWISGNYYSVGDVIYYKGTSYTCNFDQE